MARNARLNVRALSYEVGPWNVLGQSVHHHRLLVGLHQKRFALLERVGFGYFGADFLRLDIHLVSANIGANGKRGEGPYAKVDPE
ncbi:hypothetical protein AB6813_14480 [bacterium RCC_150]